MKKFVLTIVFALVAVISFNANAQYATQQTGKENLTDNLYYRHYQWKEKNGRNWFLAGLGVQAIGAGMLLAAPIVLENGSYYEPQYRESVGWQCPPDADDLAEALTIAGSIAAISGTLMEVFGGIRWLSASANLRNMRFDFMLKNNGLVVAF